MKESDSAYAICMTLDGEDVKEFKEIYEQEFGEIILAADAQILASQLIRLYDALCEPLPGEMSAELARIPDPVMLDG